MKELWFKYWIFLLVLLAITIVGFDIWVDGVPKNEGYEKGFVVGLALGWMIKGLNE